jgi:hypothetical protein
MADYKDDEHFCEVCGAIGCVDLARSDAERLREALERTTRALAEVDRYVRHSMPAGFPHATVVAPALDEARAALSREGKGCNCASEPRLHYPGCPAEWEG